jgi:hypothetical protein
MEIGIKGGILFYQRVGDVYRSTVSGLNDQLEKGIAEITPDWIRGLSGIC